MAVIIAFALLLLVLGIIEKRTHQKKLDSIPLRINVNGIRGKSTATRLITSILAESGVRVVGKTTGTAARMIYWSGNHEKEVIRSRQGANIGEQIKVVAEASKLGAEALVCECMAIKPEYQIAFQDQLLQANIGVIVNVLEDHMDVMGPTLDDVAKALAATIPWKGHLIINKSPYVEYFSKIAQQRSTKVIIADQSKVPEEYLNNFDYILLPENIAIALAVAQALKIDEEVALRGMLKAQPDPGVLRITSFGDKLNPSYFVNGFAANEPASTIALWHHIQTMGYPIADPVVIINCRGDRVYRTKQFVKDFFPYFKAHTLILIGSNTKIVTQGFKSGKFPIKNLLDLGSKAPEEIINIIEREFPGRTVYGIGNIHGVGEGIVKELEARNHLSHTRLSTNNFQGRLSIEERGAVY